MRKTISLGALLCALAYSFSAHANDTIWLHDNCPDTVTWEKGFLYGKPCVNSEGLHGIYLHDVKIETPRFEGMGSPNDPHGHLECVDGEPTYTQYIVCAVRS